MDKNLIIPELSELTGLVDGFGQWKSEISEMDGHSEIDAGITVIPGIHPPGITVIQAMNNSREIGSTSRIHIGTLSAYALYRFKSERGLSLSI
jgi:hypothetical protein